MNLGELLSPQAGQDRRAWLNSLDERIDDTLGYYLKPMMPQVRAATSAATEFTDVADYRDAVVGADQMFNAPGGWDKAAGAGLMTSAIAAALVPGVSRRVAEGVTDAGVDMARFLADEDGGIRVWHASPHDFDRFTLDKMGTGEGAQAYGHGLYFAESPAVSGVGGEYYKSFSRRMPIQPEMKDYLDEAELLGYDTRRGALSAIQSDPMWRSAYDVPPDVADKIEAALPASSPRVYEVDLHANPEDFLDWDAPLSAQPESVRAAYGRAVARGDPLLSELLDGSPESIPLMGLFPNSKGSQAYNSLMEKGFEDGAVGLNLPAGNPMKPADKWSSERLREAGIPGIRYLDQGSRGASDGTRNYVVFDENIIEIVKKFGIAGAAAMLGMSAGELEAQVAQQPVAIGDWLRGSDEDATATLQEYLR